MKKINTLIMLLFSVIIILSFNGCNNPENNESVNISFVVGIADKETKINENIDELSKLSASPGSDFTFISVEGVPTCIGDSSTVADFSDKGYTDAMLERLRAGIQADLANRLTSFTPSSSELDIASSIELAVKSLNVNAIEGRKNILVLYTSGKSTKGLINMLETPVYKLDIETSVPAIADKMQLDMSDVDEIIWYCCGEFGNGVQPQLSSSEKAHMREFYEQLFYTLGAKKVEFKDNPPSAECYKFEDKKVSVIEVEDTVSVLKELVVLEPEVFNEIDETTFDKAIVIPEEKVQYLPDSAEFLYPDLATTTIQPVADFLLEHPEHNILLYGTCAGDVDSDYTLWLSRARAESVKDVLCDFGIEENRITVATIKVADDPYYQFGLGTGAEASVNRKTVMILDLTTEFAQQILSKAQ